MFPDTEMTQELVNEKGLFSFYRDGHAECCKIRKVEPLKRALGGLKAWITGVRKDQSATRVALDNVQVDGVFKGKNDSPLVKFNPLANVTSEQVWDYIKKNDVPYNELHDKGFKSIGCQPCTRPIKDGQHEREGRWWWESVEEKECGLHQKK